MLSSEVLYSHFEFIHQSQAAAEREAARFRGIMAVADALVSGAWSQMPEAYLLTPRLERTNPTDRAATSRAAAARVLNAIRTTAAAIDLLESPTRAAVASRVLAVSHSADAGIRTRVGVLRRFMEEAISSSPMDSARAEDLDEFGRVIERDWSHRRQYHLFFELAARRLARDAAALARAVPSVPESQPQRGPATPAGANQDAPTALASHPKSSARHSGPITRPRKKLRPTWSRARSLWQTARGADPKLRTLKDIHTWLAARSEYALGLPSHGTFARYVRGANLVVDGPRKRPACDTESVRSAVHAHRGDPVGFRGFVANKAD